MKHLIAVAVALFVITLYAGADYMQHYGVVAMPGASARNIADGNLAATTVYQIPSNQGGLFRVWLHAAPTATNAAATATVTLSGTYLATAVSRAAVALPLVTFADGVDLSWMQRFDAGTPIQIAASVAGVAGAWRYDVVVERIKD